MPEKIIDRIRKLFAKAESAAEIGSAEEAATFAAKANELLLRHKLEMTNIELADEQATDPIEQEDFDIGEPVGLGNRTRSSWSEQLFQGIAYAHFCEILLIRGKKFILVGRTSDRELVRYLYATLASHGNRLAASFARAELRKWGDRSAADTRRLKTDFLMGYYQAINKRLRERRAQVEQQGGQFALVRFQNADAEVAAAFRARFPRVHSAGRIGRGVQNARAYGAGQEAGNAANLHGGIGGSTSSSRSTLSGGALLLGGGA
jgi:hypothetical protein